MRKCNFTQRKNKSSIDCIHVGCRCKTVNIFLSISSFSSLPSNADQQLNSRAFNGQQQRNPDEFRREKEKELKTFTAAAITHITFHFTWHNIIVHNVTFSPSFQLLLHSTLIVCLACLPLSYNQVEFVLAQSLSDSSASDYYAQSCYLN